MKTLLMEFLGTFFLVLTIGLTGNPLAIGLMLAALVYIGGHVSGAHYNPAVTLAAWIRGGFNGNVLAYWGAQFVGAFAAAASILYIVGAQFIPAPGDVTMGVALLVEVLFTFVLVITILSVTSKALKGNYVYGLAIGIALTAIAYAGGGISGGAYNPAVGIAPLLFSAIMGGSLAHAWLYLVGPLAGGALAAMVFKVLNPKG